MTQRHGQADELSKFGPPGVEYSFLPSTTSHQRLIRSPIKDYLAQVDASPVDLVEAQLTPVLTDRPWICTLAALPQATAFNLLGAPIPRSWRLAYVRRLLLKDNCKKLVFLSEAGRNTLHTYGRLADDDRLLEKVEVVYPAVREVPDDRIVYADRPIRMLFSGDFFRKGGVNVVDAFEIAQRTHPGITLTLCCSAEIDFNTPNAALKTQYLDRIGSNPAIQLRGRVPREQFLHELLPACDVFLIPTYAETFGMAVIEAMAHGRPVVATNHFAIPEMVAHEVSGLLVDLEGFDTETMFRGYVVDEIPRAFRDMVTTEVHRYICRLAESRELRVRLGTAALAAVRSKFSFARRNREIGRIYNEALQ